jgi:hypothetical protein
MTLNPTARATARRNVADRIDRFLNILQRARRLPNRRELFWLRHALANLQEGQYPAGEDAMDQFVCEIAFKNVKPSTRAAIVALIQADGEFNSFADSCTWPDHPRKRAPEHFVNLPRDSSGATDICGGAPECVVTAIAKDLAILCEAHVQ